MNLRASDIEDAKVLPLLRRAGVTVVVRLNGAIIVRDKRTGKEIGGIELKRRLNK